MLKISGQPYKTGKEFDNALALANGKRGLYHFSLFLSQFRMGNEEIAFFLQWIDKKTGFF